MKEKLIWIVAIILAIVLGFYGQKIITPMLQDTEQVDSVQQGVEIPSIEEFTTPESVLLYKRNLELQTFYDSMMVSLPSEIVDQVSAVVIDRYGTATKEEIIDEYINNADIYDSSYKRRRSQHMNDVDTILYRDNNIHKSEEVNTNRPRDDNGEKEDIVNDEKDVELRAEKEK